ncbi:f-box domain protein [Neofusicoccum parvum]|uniref:F-box domain protein n=1 Tax=Neofusicoccum parvum TaxID=310453 RepID=A0ACB5RQ42_9PEZI|nr:f-box domain protein [Neofusicoccum parvum]GME47146.1 f-box domain protein [Neofusicoccum parvum]
MGAGRDQVFRTPELLELILLHLPMRDLLLAQRVCQTFRTLVRTSPTLQQALFFKPLPATALPQPSSPSYLRSHPSRKPTAESWERNPLLIPDFWPWFDRDDPTNKYSPTLRDPDTLKTLPLATERRVWLRPEASWRRMLVVQPPVGQLEMMRMFHGMSCDDLADGTLCLGQGLTMGVLYDITCQEVLGVRNNTLRSFRVQWHGAERRVVFVIKHVRQCTFGHFDNSDWKSFFSGACEGRAVAWKPRDLSNEQYGGARLRVPRDILAAGDYDYDPDEDAAAQLM